LGPDSRSRCSTFAPASARWIPRDRRAVVVIGPCQYMTCKSQIGASFRGEFSYLDPSREPDHRGRIHIPGWSGVWPRFDEVLLCPEHERLCVNMKRGGELVMTEEGWVYGRTWMASLAFMT
jgi:hypothetical protein